MAISSRQLAKILKLAAKGIEASDKKCQEAEAETKALSKKVLDNEKMARARAVATKLVVGDDVRREIDEKTQKMASQDMDIVEKALELGRTEAVLKLGEAMVASRNHGNKSDSGTENVLVNFLATLI